METFLRDHPEKAKFWYKKFPNKYRWILLIYLCLYCTLYCMASQEGSIACDVYIYNYLLEYVKKNL